VVRRGAFYVDSSAIVKLVVREAETEALLGLLAGAQLISSELAAVEVPRAAHLKTGATETIAHAESLVRHLFLVVLDDDLRRAAARAHPPELRSLDAVHLASALRVRDEIDAVVAYDRRLAKAVADTDLQLAAPT
jgi:predicted nucleic acid-binding protein